MIIAQNAPITYPSDNAIFAMHLGNSHYSTQKKSEDQSILNR